MTLITNVIKIHKIFLKATDMNKWQKVVKTLTDAGFSQYEIASFVGCSQSQVNALLHGHRGKRLSFDIAQNLVSMNEKVQRGEIIPKTT